MRYSSKVANSSENSFRPSGNKSLCRSLSAFFLFLLAAYLIYLPILNNFFVSDDFNVLYRVCIQQIIFIKKFFRPLSDMSIYLNYKLGGLNPSVFNAFNIMIHGINAYLLFLICLNVENVPGKSKKTSFAWISAALFLCYPFHNEAVVWLLGRGASLSCLFALLSILAFYRIKKEFLKYGFACLFFFISLSAYESTIFFPIIFILWLCFENQKPSILVKWAIALITTLAFHLTLRYWISGSLLGSYGQGFFHFGINAFLLNMAKVGGRMILPPAHNAAILSAVFFLILGSILFYVIKKYPKIKNDPFWRTIFFLAIMLFVSCFIPFLTGVSTQTSETDRILYFPSVFLCLIAGIFLVYRIKSSWNRWIAIWVITSYSLFLLEKNNMNWRKASLVSFSILEKIDEKKRLNESGKIYFLNIPNEVEGAYVFRLGFTDALKLYGYDSSQYIAVNYLPRQDLEKIKKQTRIDPIETEIRLPPDIFLSRDASGCRQIIDHGVLKFTTRPGDRIFFWNMDRLETLQACEVRIRE